MSTEEPLSDRIRAFVLETVVRPALQAGKTSLRVRAGDIHRDMGLSNRMPAVCSVLESKKFQALAGLTLANREGPHRGANVVFIYQKCATTARESPRTSKPAAPKPATRSPIRRLNRMPGTEIWISCVARKRSQPSAAKDLYLSDWFIKARTYAESTGLPWQILSAKHGLVPPERVISPYDLTLNKLPVDTRRDWASQVASQVQTRNRAPSHVILLAGARYREFLIPRLAELGISVEVPMLGLRIGEQLKWLNDAVSHG